MATQIISEKEKALIAAARRHAGELAARPGAAAAAGANGGVALALPPGMAAASIALPGTPHQAGTAQAPGSAESYARLALIIEAERRNTQLRKARMKMTGTVIVAVVALPFMVWLAVLILKHVLR
ncbi:MAG: hypothetical protein IT514_06910 [Burkholderiales bacterium]|nr:hypothetical protein [Burkholderiales bacterium]